MDATEAHIKYFGMKPVIIGLLWRDQDKLEEEIYNAIERNSPYNEEKQLSQELLNAYLKGELLF